MLEREVDILRRDYAEKEREWELETTELSNEVKHELSLSQNNSLYVIYVI